MSFDLQLWKIQQAYLARQDQLEADHPGLAPSAFEQVLLKDGQYQALVRQEKGTLERRAQHERLKSTVRRPGPLSARVKIVREKTKAAAGTSAS